MAKNHSELIKMRQFGGVVRVFGEQAVNRFFGAHIAIVGLGGVGSWAAEVLARSGIGQLTLIDFDHVAESNINRQIHALHSTLGVSKIEALAQRILDINPHCQVVLVDDFLSADNIDMCFANKPDVILDCADQFKAKLAMVLYAKEHSISLVVCGGAGGKSDPLTLTIGDLSKATHDPLLSKLRQQLRKYYSFPVPTKQAGKVKTPKMNVLCAWFAQEVVRPPLVEHRESLVQAPQGLSCAGYGSIVSVTAIMGMQVAHQGLLLVQHAKVSTIR